MILNWGNALSTAGAAAGAVGFEGVRATLDQQKIQLASDLSEKRQIGLEQRAPGVAAATETATADAKAASTVKNAPGLLSVKVAETQAVGAAQTKVDLDRFQQLAPAKRAEEIAAAVEKVKALSTPEMLDSARKIALAHHIVDPSFTLIPNADGTVTTFDIHSGKSGGVLKDADGNPVVRKDPEEMKAAVAVINMANTNLKIAEAAFKADSSSLEPGVKEKATATWEAAQQEAKQLSAPAYAVLYQKAKIPAAPDAPPGKPAGPATPKTQAELDALAPGAEFVNPRDGKVYRKPAAKAATAAPASTTAVDPNKEPEAPFSNFGRLADAVVGTGQAFIDRVRDPNTGILNRR